MKKPSDKTMKHKKQQFRLSACVAIAPCDGNKNEVPSEFEENNFDTFSFEALAGRTWAKNEKNSGM